MEWPPTGHGRGSQAGIAGPRRRNFAPSRACLAIRRQWLGTGSASLRRTVSTVLTGKQEIEPGVDGGDNEPPLPVVKGNAHLHSAVPMRHGSPGFCLDRQSDLRWMYVFAAGACAPCLRVRSRSCLRSDPAFVETFCPSRDSIWLIPGSGQDSSASARGPGDSRMGMCRSAASRPSATAVHHIGV